MYDVMGIGEAVTALALFGIVCIGLYWVYYINRHDDNYTKYERAFMTALLVDIAQKRGLNVEDYMKYDTRKEPGKAIKEMVSHEVQKELKKVVK